MSVIDEVKQKTDIVEIINQYTTLKKAGRNLSATCPFHNETHPSFYVYPEQQSWHCFGACNTGGDVFSFLMKKENIDFGEALRRLADRAGVVIPSRPEREGAREERDALHQVNDAAALYFNNLLANSPAAAKAREYVASRGFTPQTVADFQLGFAMDGWETLKSYLLEKGFDEKTQLAAGLIIASDDGKTHDRFRGKLMFPIRDARGRTIGFGGRALDGSMPKYTNSPQTPVFDKSGTLYALDRASASIRKLDAAIIMEGYMDVITAHQNGVTNVVASMGVAITETQVNTLKKLTRNLLLSLDADAAGEEAMLRGVGYENTLDAEIRVIILPEGQDPDDVIKTDVNRWQELAEQAVPIVDYTFDKAAAKLDLSTARDKAKLVEQLLPVVTAIGNPVRQSHYLQKLARLAGVTEKTLEEAIDRAKPAPAPRRAVAVRQTVPVRAPRNLAANPKEEYCLALLLQHPELKGRQDDLFPELFESSQNREIFNTWHDSGDADAIRHDVDPALREHLDAIINRELPVTDNMDRRYNDCVMELRKRYLKGLAARRAALGEAASDIDIEISAQLKELDAHRIRKRPEIRR